MVGSFSFANSNHSCNNKSDLFFPGNLVFNSSSVVNDDNLVGIISLFLFLNLSFSPETINL